MNQYQYYLIVDLEATCCNQKSISRHEMEIIEIGAVMVDAENLQIVDEYQVFIKPCRYPLLTSFCTQLTSITQAEVDSGLSFVDAIEQFKQWMYQFDNFVFCSWGDYDKSQFIQDCGFHQCAYPFKSEHINIKKLFSDKQNLTKKQGMAGALKLAGIKLEGKHHRGIDDARNMAKLAPYIFANEVI